MLRNANGNWNVPYANWNGSKFNRNANWLDNDWNSNYRVVLLVTLFVSASLLLGCGAVFFLDMSLPSVEHSSDFFQSRSNGYELFLLHPLEFKKDVQHKFQNIIACDGSGNDRCPFGFEGKLGN